jgi:TetR/AcrR family transcriptional regulator, cholesterol catabolism regulator
MKKPLKIKVNIAGSSGRHSVTKSASPLAKGPRGRPPIYSRNDILQVAKAAFSKSGYANVSLDDLAAKLKTGKGTLYYHSSRKVDLLIAISRDIIGASIAELRRIHRLKVPPDVQFVMAFRSHMGSILSDIQSSKIYFENEVDLPLPIRDELRAVMREIENIFIAIAEEGVRTGVFKRDPRMAIRHAMAVCAWPYRWYLPGGLLSRDEFIDNAADFALSALRAESSLKSVMFPEAPFSKAPRNAD